MCESESHVLYASTIYRKSTALSITTGIYRDRGAIGHPHDRIGIAVRRRRAPPRAARAAPRRGVKNLKKKESGRLYAEL